MTAAADGPCWQLWVDGTALPNPGRIGIGALLLGPAGERATVSCVPGAQGCNNEAEMQALIAGLQMAADAGARQLRVVSDSDFAVRHVLGQAHTTVTRLLPLIARAQHLRADFECCELVWMPRHRNGEADALARAALGLPPASSHAPVRRRRAKRR